MGGQSPDNRLTKHARTRSKLPMNCLMTVMKTPIIISSMKLLLVLFACGRHVFLSTFCVHPLSQVSGFLLSPCHTLSSIRSRRGDSLDRPHQNPLHPSPF